MPLYVSEVEKVRDYHDKLEAIFRIRISETDMMVTRATCITAWNCLLIKKGLSFANLSAFLQLTKEEHRDQINQLLRLAYFQRYPEYDSSHLSNEEMVTAVEAPTVTGVGKASDSESLQLNWSLDIVKAGFRAEYKNSDLIVEPNLALLRDWAEQWSALEHKAPYTSIIGPTMSGKTRLILELAKHVCVVYICIRPPGSSGQPPRSSLADTLLPKDQGPKFDLYLYYSRFLAAILETVADFFSRGEMQGQKSKDQLAAWLAHSFQIDENKKPEYFSPDVRTKMEALSAAMPTKKVPSDTMPAKEALSATVPTMELVADATKKMHDSIKFLEDGRLKILLAIDEARNLLPLEDETLKISYFRVFRRVLSQIPRSKGFFAVFTDTTSKVANFSPSLDKDPSLRLLQSANKLFPPIYKLATMDLMAKPIPTSWNELLSPLRLFSYGSPFYGLYFQEAIKSRRADVIDAIMRVAIAKLLCDTKPLSASQLSESHIFALLGSTIQTRLTSSDMNSALISSHAAHCMYINLTRDLIISYYPSQFVYASAANAFLASNDEILVVCINGLATAMQNGLISRGDAGEMATRIILLRAMHKTKKISCVGEDSIPYGYSVRLQDFLETLIGKKLPTDNDPPPTDKNPPTESRPLTRNKSLAGKSLTEQKPPQSDLGPIPAADRTRLLEHGRIFFNHFIPIEYTPDATDFLELLYRGLAVQCKPGQHGLDELFPIYLTPESKSPDSDKLEPKNISFCGIQTKNQQGSIDWTNSPKWSKSGAGIQDIQNPYLILLFSLRSEGKRSTQLWKEPLDMDDKRRAHYQFLGLDCIACLTPEIRTALRRLLNSTPEDVMPLHKPDPKTMPDSNTLEWIRRQNPMFYQRQDRIDVHPACKYSFLIRKAGIIASLVIT